MNRRIWAVATLAAAMSIATLPVMAQSSRGSGVQVPVSGFVNSVPATGTFTVKEFRAVGNEIRAFGTASLSYGGKAVVAAVSMPLVLPTNTANATSALQGTAFAQAAPAAASCDILNLTLGPLDLNLLGLRIQLNQVQLDITAEPGAGNLLGNLLCGVANLLNGLNLAGALNQLVAALNNLLGLLG